MQTMRGFALMLCDNIVELTPHQFAKEKRKELKALWRRDKAFEPRNGRRPDAESNGERQDGPGGGLPALQAPPPPLPCQLHSTIWGGFPGDRAATALTLQ